MTYVSETTESGGKKSQVCICHVACTCYIIHFLRFAERASGVANANAKKKRGKKNKNIPDPYMSRPRVFGRSLRTRRGTEWSAGQPAGTPTSSPHPSPPLSVSRPPAPVVTTKKGLIPRRCWHLSRAFAAKKKSVRKKTKSFSLRGRPAKRNGTWKKSANLPSCNINSAWKS